LTKDYGWIEKEGKKDHDWNILRDNIQGYIKSLNFGYKSKLQEVNVDFIPSYAKFDNDKEVSFEFNGKPYKLSAKNFVIAGGNRPRDYPGVPDLEKHAITSDDLFSLKTDPGKTLVIGGGYIALECAGFLNGLGKDVTMINRSTFLRVMDSDLSFKVIDDMEASGVKALTQTVPVGVEKLDENLYEVELKIKEKLHKIKFNTILVAIGRDANPKGMALENANIEIARSQKVKGRANEKERSNVDHIYAVGDVLDNNPEL
jgi:thioredoxin reductase (NADPH)